MWLVITKGRRDKTLFLVDRSKIKNRWWSTSWDGGMLFKSMEAAEIQARKLMYKEPEVVSLSTAKQLCRENERNIDYDSMEHPFSSDALGQD